MLGKDFFVFWQIGLAILQGQPVYSFSESLYPPAMMMLFTPLGLLPFTPAFALWCGMNVILFLLYCKKRKLKKPGLWFLYTPVIFILMTGQIDILFLWIAGFLLDQKRWKNILGAVLLTLKPQIAFILLPWVLLRWLKKEPRSILYWLSASLGLHLLPLLFDVNIYQKWIESIASYGGSRMLISPGIFSLTNFHIPIWVLLLLSMAVAVYGLTRDKETSKAAQILALPMGIWYEDVFLSGSIPAKILIPASWAAFILAYLLKSSVPFMLIPLLVFLWKKSPEINGGA